MKIFNLVLNFMIPFYSGISQSLEQQARVQSYKANLNENILSVVFDILKNIKRVRLPWLSHTYRVSYRCANILVKTATYISVHFRGHNFSNVPIFVETS